MQTTTLAVHGSLITPISSIKRASSTSFKTWRRDFSGVRKRGNPMPERGYCCGHRIDSLSTAMEMMPFSAGGERNFRSTAKFRRLKAHASGEFHAILSPFLALPLI